MSENYQARKFHIVLNSPEKYNLNSDDISKILDSMHLDYYCFSKEISDTGTLHMHIFIYSAISPIRFSTVKNKFPHGHIEKSYGSVLQNKQYILKEGKWKDTDKAHTSIENSFVEKGEIPTEESEKAPLMTKIISYINKGMSTAQIIKENPKLAFKTKEIDTLRQTLLSEKYSIENRNVKVIYIYGVTGSGKTSGIYKEHNPIDVCRITQYKGDRILFDAYHQQPVLVLEEFHSQIPLPDLLSILDIYPLMLPARYSDRVACYDTVYILSNIPLNEQYKDVQLNDSATWDALLRRIHIIREYHSDKTYSETIVHKGENTWIK